MGGGILAFTLQRLRIRWLQILATRWLNADGAADLVVAVGATAVRGDWSFAVLHSASGGRHGCVLCFGTWYEAEGTTRLRSV